jgi:hypothetical protein
VLALPNPDKRTKRSDFKGDATAATQSLKSQCINVFAIESLCIWDFLFFEKWCRHIQVSGACVRLPKP